MNVQDAAVIETESTECPGCGGTCTVTVGRCAETEEMLSSHCDCDCGYISITDHLLRFVRRPGETGSVWIIGLRKTTMKELTDREAQRIIESRVIKSWAS